MSYLIAGGALFAAGCWAGRNTAWGGRLGAWVGAAVAMVAATGSWLGSQDWLANLSTGLF